MNAQQAKKMLAGAMVLSLALSGGLLTGSERADAAGSSGLSRHGLSATQVAQLQDMKTRWRKQTEEHKHGSALLEEAASILNLSSDALKKQLEAGKSLAEIAEAQGVKKITLTEKLVSARTSKLEEAVTAGRITRERADQIQTRLSGHIANLVERKGWSEETGFRQGKSKSGKSKGEGHSARTGGLWSALGPDKLASIAGVTKDELLKQLKDGQSLSEIAAAHGIKKEDLVARIKEALTPELERAVERKHRAKQE